MRKRGSVIVLTLRPQMERKLATVLFVDLVDSTSLVSASDPEIVRRRVTRFFDQRLALHRDPRRDGREVRRRRGHGRIRHPAGARGRRRARRSGGARDPRLDRELGLEARIGIEAGEVVDRRRRLDVRNGRGRQPRRAPPAGRRAGPDPDRARPRTGSRSAGSRSTTSARSTCAAATSRSGPGPRPRADGRAPARVAVTPLVGREHELELLENTFARAMRDRRAHLFTVYGEPGVGKSRLANEFLASLEGTTILTGRCLPYGESITYWPLAEMVKGAAGHRRRRPDRRRDREAARVLPGRGGRRSARARDRRARGRPRRAQPAGDRVGGARVGAADGRRRSR